MAKIGYSSRSIASTLTNKHGINMPHTLLCRILHGGRKPLQWLRVSKKRILGGVNKKARVAFCKEWKYKRPHTFDTWVFLDAKDVY